MIPRALRLLYPSAHCATSAHVAVRSHYATHEGVPVDPLNAAAESLDRLHPLGGIQGSTNGEGTPTTIGDGAPTTVAGRTAADTPALAAAVQARTEHALLTDSTADLWRRLAHLCTETPT